MLAHALRLSCLFALSLAPWSGVHAQSIWGVDGPARLASNTAGPPGCTICPIAGPLLSALNYGAPTGGTCTPPGPFPPPSFGPFGSNEGDITVNRVADSVWITDGQRVTEYNKAWATLADFANPLPFPLTGLGYQAPNVLWLTDGWHIASVVAPVGCGGGPPPLVANLPVPGLLVGLLTDIDYDPCTARLYVSASNGLIGSLTTSGGTPAIHPLSICSLMLPFLSGLAVDTATPGTMFITDGITVTRVQEVAGSGVMATAATRIYAPCLCWPWAGSGPTSGLAFDATPIETCPGCNPSGAPPPRFWATHEAISPNASFGFALSGAPALAPAFLVVGTCVCSGIVLPCGCSLCVNPMVISPVATSGTGSVVLPVPIPGAYACLGLGLCAQFVFKDPSTGCFFTSNALNLSLAAP